MTFYSDPLGRMTERPEPRTKAGRLMRDELAEDCGALGHYIVAIEDEASREVEGGQMKRPAVYVAVILVVLYLLSGVGLLLIVSGLLLAYAATRRAA